MRPSNAIDDDQEGAAEANVEGREAPEERLDARGEVVVPGGGVDEAVDEGGEPEGYAYCEAVS